MNHARIPRNRKNVIGRNFVTTLPVDLGTMTPTAQNA